MPIVPDTKDWTWVLVRPCPECGFDASALVLDEVPELVRTNAAAWRVVLGDERVRRRPSDDVWSALEYGCHVRDVFRLYDERLALMLEQDDPRYPNWDQDQTAIEQGYDRQSPSKVADELESAAFDIAGAVRDRVGRPVATHRPAQRRRQLHRRDVRRATSSMTRFITCTTCTRASTPSLRDGAALAGIGLANSTAVGSSWPDGSR